MRMRRNISFFITLRTTGSFNTELLIIYKRRSIVEWID